MRIVVVSDSHGNKNVLDKIVFENPSANLFLHAGDSGLSVLEIAPFVAVRGNCDYEDRFLDEIIIGTPYGKILLTHGHRLHYLNKDFFLNKGIKILVFGHTHVCCFEKLDDFYIFNPGSVSLPKDESRGSYLVLDIDETNVLSKFVRL